MSIAEILRTYSSIKGHRTRVKREIQSLLDMLKVQYSAPSEVRVNDRLEKLEKYTHRLSDIKDYLITAKYPKAGDHADEVAEFLTTLDQASTQIFKVIHDRHAAAPQAAIAAPPTPTRSHKPSAELKPKELLHDASMASFRTWKKQFKAYFDAGNLISLPCSQQQAYLNNCVDETLASRIDRESTATTPVYSPVQGLFTCIQVLDGYFLEVNPVHLRRKQFFDARQKEGQSIIEFRDELLSLIDEADGATITVSDLVCMMLQIGASDSALQKELGAIQNPTLPAFNRAIEGYEQARKTTAPTAHGNAAQTQQKNSRQNNPRGRGEKDRRLALRGRCFRCAKDDHMLPNCSYPADVKCNLCSAPGHITPACSRRQNARTAQQVPASVSSGSQQQLALTFDGSFPADGSSWAGPHHASSVSSAPSQAGAFYTPANLPTPEMPL